MPFVPRASFAWRLYRRLVRTHVEFFSVPEGLPDVDVLKLCSLPAPFPGVPNESCPTILIDLAAPEEDLWNGVDPKTRKVIRQADRENIVVERLPELTKEAWDDFFAAYGKLWRRKNRAGALGVGQIGELAARGQLVMTASRDGAGHVLSWHGYAFAHGRARLLNTASDMDPARGTQWNNLIGRAHRLHHWRDILQFKANGARIYDLGGVYRGVEDQEQANIARFKRNFGGQFVETYDAVVPLTLKGRLALSLVARINPETRAGGPALKVPA